MNRRGFLGSILALGAAPAIVRASSLMKVAAPAGNEHAIIDLLVRRMKQAGDDYANALTRDLYAESSGFYSTDVAFELNRITRAAFIPKLIEQVYETTPLATALMGRSMKDINDLDTSRSRRARDPLAIGGRVFAPEFTPQPVVYQGVPIEFDS